MRGAKLFLEAITKEWRNVDEIVRTAVRTFNCADSDIRQDFEEFIGELISQRFVAVEEDGLATGTHGQASVAPPSSEVNLTKGEPDELLPTVELYKRHFLPSGLHIDLTDRCNERCVHCYIPKGGGVMMPTELAMKVLREFREAQGLTVFITGGECMLHPGFANILREAKRLGLNIIVMSNLALCDAEKVSLLKEVDPQFVNVSLYSMRAAEHDAITQVPESWDDTISAIWDLQQAGVHVRLATPIMKANRNAVAVLRRFAADHHMHDVFDCDIIGKMDHDCSNQQHALTIDEMAEVIRAHRDILAKSPLDARQCTPDARVCDIGDGHLCINAHGDYYPCDGFHGMVLGNANKDALIDVWRGEKLNRLRAMKNRDFGECATCNNRPWCKVCMMRNFNETGDMFKHAPERCKMAAMYRMIWEEK